MRHQKRLSNPDRVSFFLLIIKWETRYQKLLQIPDLVSFFLDFLRLLLLFMYLYNQGSEWIWVHYIYIYIYYYLLRYKIGNIFFMSCLQIKSREKKRQDRESAKVFDILSPI
jgi:hypothetical protein